MRKFNSVIVVLGMLLNTSLFFALLANNVNAQDLDYEIRETIPIPSEYSGASIMHVGDMDGDGILDIVLMKYYAGKSDVRIHVIERDGGTFIERYTIQEDYGRGSIVAEVDGDGMPEILSTNIYGRARIFEASGDNTYALRKTMTSLGKIEGVFAGDSDGDGKREFLISAEWRGVYIYESPSDNAYSLEATLYGSPGSNGNIQCGAVYDLDGDGNPETVFGADPYDPYRSTVYVFDKDHSQIYHKTGLRYSSIGDLDGNGRGEIIGLTMNSDWSPKELLIIESTGTNDNFVEVLRTPPNDYFIWAVMDVDEDGQSELWRPIDDSSSGQLDVFTLAHRNGGTISDFYNSGELLQSFSGDIRGLLAIGDTNGDSNLEIAVVQGNQIHILEIGTSNSDDDGDGVLNVSDNCPDTPNPDQADTDGDGQGDACDTDYDNDGIDNVGDNCPLVANTNQADTDGDGTGDLCDDDLDGDTVPNDADNCPANPNLEQTDTDNDGMGDECDANDDNDYFLDVDDNCPTIVNDDQADLDGDGIGDACDIDIDGDGVENDDDNCPLTGNTSQDDTDYDGAGDACDEDDDNDGVLDVDDNCSLIANPSQDDTDGDGRGDVCDDDLDGDGVDNDYDNCPTMANSSQYDFDGDGLGDACDPDIDGDGVANASDLCADTPQYEIVDPAIGCSIAQLCPCEGPRGTTVSWRNHGKYVSCVAKTSENFVEQGLITEAEKDSTVSEAAQSDCGDKK